ncbi:MAG: methyl-accepting chemotaxis protein [Pseudomonadota bacterium]
MMTWLKTKSITARISLVIGVLTVGLLIFASIDAFERYHVTSELKDANEIVHIVPAVGNIIHELQKERGKSAGFISSKGANFSEALPKVHLETDEKFELLKNVFSTFQFERYPLAIKQTAETVAEDLELISDIRSRVRNLEISVPEMAKYYTDTINDLLDVIIQLQHADHDYESGNYITAHIGFLQAKEAAGLERAMGATGFGRGEFSRDIYNKLVKFISVQDVHFNTYLKFTGEAEKKFFKEKLEDPSFKQVENLRQIALVSPESGTLADVTATQWFETITKKIELLKEVEDFNIEQLETKVENKFAAATTVLVLEVAFIVVFLAVSFVLVYFVARSIKLDLSDLAGLMQNLASGDNNIDVERTDRKDELGEMNNAIVVFKDAALAKHALEESAAMEARDKEARKEEEDKIRKASAEKVQDAVSNVGTALKRLAEGNLSTEINAVLSEEYEQLKMDFNSAAQKLREALADVSQSAEDIFVGTREIAQASDDMSRRTEDQAGALEAAAAALDQITNTVKSTADVAAEAQSIVGEANQKACNGGEIVDQAVEAMNAIETSSQEVSNIISVIDEIAFQTNLLALNAGVEAARAGESGRGFAVVATEVRELAQRSADAAKQIKTLITHSNKEISSGVKLVRETGVNLKTLVEEINNLSGLVTEISNGAQSQADGLVDVNNSVGQLDLVTQQNAAMAEEATAASQVLTTKSEHLTKLVGNFDLGLAQSFDDGGDVDEKAA